MELEVHQLSFLTLGALAQKTLCVLPLAKKKQQKVAVGDDRGELTVFYLKKAEINIEWKSEALGREITCVTLQLAKDKIFCGCGQSIHGFTRKGKEFVKIKTNLTETIQHLFVDDQMIWTGGEFIMNLYDSCKDAGFVMVKDRINDLTCVPITNGNLVSLIPCQDKLLRAYAGEKLYHEFALEGAGTTVGFYGGMLEDKTVRGPTNPLIMLQGLDTGVVSVILVDSNSIRSAFDIKEGKNTKEGIRSPSASGNTKRRAAVSSVISVDFNQSGVHDIAVGREDGAFEVYNVGSLNAVLFNTGRLDNVLPQLVFESNLNENIRAMDTGAISTGHHTEIVLTTFTGRVLGFTPDPSARDATGAAMAQQDDADEAPKKKKKAPANDAQVNQEKEKRLVSLKNEVERLKEKVQAEKTLYAQKSNEGIAVQPTMKITHKFALNSEEACYILVVDSQSPIELVALRGDVNVDLLDFDSAGAGAILSRSRGDPMNPLLATYRLQEPCSRFQIRMRTVEGANGNITLFVMPTTQPKIAYLMNLPIKPLSLHEKDSAVSTDTPMNELKLSGQFTLMDMHQWLSLCVNELPSRPNEDEVTVAYRNTFIGSWLTGRYGKGSAIFKSDSIITISVLKDVISKEATNRKIQMSIGVDVKDETFRLFLELMHPKMSFQHSLTQQVRLVEPLKEVEIQEGECSFLTPELMNVLKHATEIQQQFEMQPARLKFLQDIIITSYKHKWRLRGHQSVEHKLKDLQNLLDNYNLDQIVAFFDEPV